MMGILLDAAYLAVLVIAGPFYFAWRLLRRKRLAPLRPRLGAVLPPRAGAGPVLWIHAVSVGETLALRALIAELRSRRPDLRIVLTVTTVAGLEVARRTYLDLDVRESPLDFSFAVKRFLRRIRPAVLVLTELELWPNLLRLARKGQVPIFVVNARISERSQRRYGLVRRIWPGFLAGIERFFAQSEEHADRLRALGVGPDRIEVTGNLKLDNVLWQDRPAARARIAAELGWAEGDRVLIAGSTHPGEEATVAAAFRALSGDFPGCRLIVAPRHLERIEPVLSVLTDAGLRPVRWSRRGAGLGGSCVVVDTVGELARLYGVADVAFVGGTLARIGGHNLLEPAVFGIPMLVGPHHWTVKDTARLFEQAGALAIVHDVATLTAGIRSAFGDPARARERAGTVRAVLESHRGAALRCAERLVAALPA